MRRLFTIAFLLAAIPAFSQVDSTQHLTFSGFVDAYYVYDFNQPPNHERPRFLYNHNRHNEFNINLAFLKAAYSSNTVRGNLALMAGTYAQYNLAAEPDLLQNIFEANAGVRLRKDLWLDAGIFASHLGLESAVSKDNFTLTRSLAAENSPYYENGVKVTYQTGSKWTFTGLVLNGWQNIREPEGNANKALGTQIQFKPSATILLNSSSFMGNEKPDSTRQRRYFHDFYAVIQLQPRLKLAAVFDIGAEKRIAAGTYDFWYASALLVHYKIWDKIAVASRMEYFYDKEEVIISSGTPNGFQTSGYSLNVDFAPVANVLCRVEGRLLDSHKPVFRRGSQAVDKSTAITTSIAVAF